MMSLSKTLIFLNPYYRNQSRVNNKFHFPKSRIIVRYQLRITSRIYIIKLDCREHMNLRWAVSDQIYWPLLMTTGERKEYRLFL